MRRLAALALAVVGQALLATLDPSLAAVPAFATFAGAAALVLQAHMQAQPRPAPLRR